MRLSLRESHRLERDFVIIIGGSAMIAGDGRGKGLGSLGVQPKMVVSTIVASSPPDKKGCKSSEERKRGEVEGK